MARLSQLRVVALVAAPLALAIVRPAAAEVRLPLRCPPARVTQKAGLTRIAVEYDAPAVAGRRIWGGVVPSGTVWRTGVAAAPRITFDREVSIADRTIPAGTYALLTIPGDGAWTVILNRDATLKETASYRADLDVARTRAVAEEIAHRERLAFSFSDFTDDQAWLDLEWETRRVRIPIQLHTTEQIEASLRTLDTFPRRFAEAARYLREAKPGSVRVSNMAWADAALTLAPQDTAMRAPRLPADSSPAQEGPPKGPAIAAMEPLPPLPAAAPVSVAPAVATVRERGVRVHGPSGAARAPGAADIGPLVKRGQGAIRACYQRALRQDPSLTDGRINVSVTIGVSGLVKDVALSPPHPGGALEPCIKQAVSRWVFPLSPVEYATEFPIVLRGR